jgi:hypothetical protein
MVKTSKEQRKARREERAWNTWLWGAKGNAVWDETGRKALRLDQALRQNARTAAAEISQVESEQFAWQAGRWGQQPALAPADGDLLMAALRSLGDISLKDVQDIQKQQRSNSLSESDSKSGSSGDEAEPGASSRNVSTSGGTGDRQRDQNSGRSRETTSEGKKCGCRGSGRDCRCKAGGHILQQTKAEGNNLSSLTKQTRRNSWSSYLFGAERPIHCSCLWSMEKSNEAGDDLRKRRQGNLSPVDKVSDDVL